MSAAAHRLRPVLIPLAIVALGAVIMIALIAMRPRPARERPLAAGALVEVLEVAPVDRNAVVRGTGSVAPRYEVALIPQITGKVAWVHPDLVAGMTFRAGDELLRIEADDYELAVQRAEAQIAQAEYQLDLARANAAIARREWELMKGNGVGFGAAEPAEEPEPDPLVLHEPQLRQAQANLASARATLATARLNLDRTVLRAPFDCRVREQKIAPGQLVGPTSQVALLYATDLVEVAVGVPIDELNWIAIPGARAEVTLETGGASYRWDGEVHRSVGVLDPVGRLAQVVVRVADPFVDRGPDEAELSIGSFVHVRIHGRLLRDVIPIPRAALRQGAQVWVARPDSTLETRTVVVTRLTPSEALIGRGLQAGERVVVSALSGAADGMPLRPVLMHRDAAQPGGPPGAGAPAGDADAGAGAPAGDAGDRSPRGGAHG